MEIKGFEDTIQWYNENAATYADSSYRVLSSALIKELTNRFIALLPLGSKILDAGCGAGKDSYAFHKLGTNVIGLDISEGLINEAKKRNPEIEFVEGSFLEIPFESSSFDGVWAHASLVHLETMDDVKKAIKEFARVLKTGGILHIFTKAQLTSEKTAIVKDKISNHKRFFRYYTEDELEEVLKKESLQVLTMERTDDPHGRDEVKWIALFAKKVSQ